MYALRDLIVLENTNVVHFSCRVGKYMFKELGIRLQAIFYNRLFLTHQV